MGFNGQEWELYNMANDRTELNDLAKEEPERLKAMVTKWRDMSANVLHSEQLATANNEARGAPENERSLDRVQ